MPKIDMKKVNEKIRIEDPISNEELEIAIGVYGNLLSAIIDSKNSLYELIYKDVKYQYDRLSDWHLARKLGGRA